MRKIAVVSATRAEFGILLPLLREIESAEQAELQLIVTGMHLSPEFGHTVDEVRSSGLVVRDEVELLLSSDSRVGVAKSFGLGVVGFADCLRRLEPDLLVLLGDRYEILAVASTAVIMGIAVAHIHGGEVTEGAVDDAFRHAITKLSVWHFTSTEEYRRRVIQLGEDPDRVFNVGALGLDRILTMQRIPEDALRADLGLPAEMPVFLVTYHPDTANAEHTSRNLDAVLSALESFPDHVVAFTRANADHQGRSINRRLAEFVAARAHRYLFDSLGSERYISLAAYADAVVGNSSSGVLEVPFLGTPVIDVGDRQKGRLLPSLVQHVEPSASEITRALRRALDTDRSGFDRTSNPYYRGGAATQIAQVVLSGSIPPRAKSFYDVEYRR